MMKVSEMLNKGADTLQKAGVEEYGLDAWYLLSFCMGISKAQYYMCAEDDMSPGKQAEYEKLIAKRASRYPLQYITGSQEFMGIEYKVNENVLIPRQDTETLVEEALKYVADKDVIDMCTGSGCIAISVALLGRPKSVTAVDISQSAIDLAKENAADKGAQVIFVESDLWENVDKVYDVIISNPPYISEEEVKKLMPEVKDYEPALALEGGKDGLYFYGKIAEGAKRYLSENGMILFEIGCEQAEDVRRILLKEGFGDIVVIKDLAGRDRVVMARNVM